MPEVMQAKTFGELVIKQDFSFVQSHKVFGIYIVAYIRLCGLVVTVYTFNETLNHTFSEW